MMKDNYRKYIEGREQMDRHIYKAKRTDNGEWVEGFYFCMVHDDGYVFKRTTSTN